MFLVQIPNHNLFAVLGKENVQLHLYTSLAYAYAKKGEIDATWDIISTVERDTMLKPDVVIYTGMFV